MFKIKVNVTALLCILDFCRKNKRVKMKRIWRKVSATCRCIYYVNHHTKAEGLYLQSCKLHEVGGRLLQYGRVVVPVLHNFCNTVFPKIYLATIWFDMPFFMLIVVSMTTLNHFHRNISSGNFLFCNLSIILFFKIMIVLNDIYVCLNFIILCDIGETRKF